MDGSEKRTNHDPTREVHLAAVCGTYCGACPAYIAKHSEAEQREQRLRKRLSSGPTAVSKTNPGPSWMADLLCDGCLSGGDIPDHCRDCSMKACAAEKEYVSRCCDCGDLPCHLVTHMVDTGLLHRGEYLPNLAKMRDMGVEAWIEYEEERWRCPACGLPMSWYDDECVGCGEPRSERLFPLSED